MKWFPTLTFDGIFDWLGLLTGSILGFMVMGTIGLNAVNALKDSKASDIDTLWPTKNG